MAVMAELELSSVHESILSAVLARLDARSKVALSCTCRCLKRHLSADRYWRELVFVEAVEQQGMGPTDLVRVVQRSRGACEAIQLARTEEAREAEGQQRFTAGYKCDQVLPHTKGLRAYALAAMVPRLRRLVLDERASCVGGMTDDMARALAVHCPQLAAVEVCFARYTLPSELFTDEGLIALSEGCRELESLALHNCDRVSDRSMYALAANCPRLTSLALGGYNEHVTNGGMTVLFEACGCLASVRLSSKLLKVTDASGTALAASCPALTHVKLTRAMTDATIHALAKHSRRLREVDLHRCGGISCAALQSLVAGCDELVRLVLPQQVEVDSMVQQLPRCSLSMLEEQQLQVLALQH